MPEHQKVRTPGKKYGDHHGQGQAQAGAAGCCGAVEGLHLGADAQAVDQDEIFRQQGGQCHPCQLYGIHPIRSFLSRYTSLSTYWTEPSVSRLTTMARAWLTPAVIASEVR